MFKLKSDSGTLLGTFNSEDEAKLAGIDSGENYKQNNNKVIKQKFNDEFFDILKC